jgi:hypothetical protein
MEMMCSVVVVATQRTFEGVKVYCDVALHLPNCGALPWAHSLSVHALHHMC